MASKKNNKSNKNIQIIAAIIPVVIIIIIAVILINTTKKPATKSSSDKPTPISQYNDIPKNFVDNDGISISRINKQKITSSTVNVDVYFDYMCPFCGNFEREYDSSLDLLMASGEINLILHPLNLLDRMSQDTYYSSRAASAFYFISQNEPEKAWDFNVKMMSAEVQPDENSTGLTDEEIAKVASSVGVKQDIVNALSQHVYANYSSDVTSKMMEDSSFQGTPDIRLSLNGKTPVQWDWKPNLSKDEAFSFLNSAVEKVKNGKNPN